MLKLNWCWCLQWVQSVTQFIPLISIRVYLVSILQGTGTVQTSKCTSHWAIPGISVTSTPALKRGRAVICRNGAVVKQKRMRPMTGHPSTNFNPIFTYHNTELAWYETTTKVKKGTARDSTTHSTIIIKQKEKKTTISQALWRLKCWDYFPQNPEMGLCKSYSSHYLLQNCWVPCPPDAHWKCGNWSKFQSQGGAVSARPELHSYPGLRQTPLLPPSSAPI